MTTMLSPDTDLGELVDFNAPICCEDEKVDIFTNVETKCENPAEFVVVCRCTNCDKRTIPILVCQEGFNRRANGGLMRHIKGEGACNAYGLFDLVYSERL